MTKRANPDLPPINPDDKSNDPEERLKKLMERPAPAPRWVDPTRKDHVKRREETGS